jgi:hypothetical protein
VSKRDIHIERLQIRMRGIDARRARAAVSDLGHELLNQLSALDGVRGNVRISKIDAGTAQVGQIAKKIAGSIKPRINAK